MINVITSPEKFFGHRLGKDRTIERWNKIVDYFMELQKESNKIQVTNMGPSTMGNPFLFVVISSPDNLKNLENIRKDNLKLSDPVNLSKENVESFIRNGKAVICQSMSLHATEIGGTQMAPELAYDLISRDDEETKRILDEVVFIMVPCFNPDGQIMVRDWYYETLGTDYEGINQPFLYHKYTGHDNNRDAFMTNMIESQYMAKILFRDWMPQAYVDHHHMGSYGARLYVPPYAEPIHPHADPLIWREHSWFGAHMAYRLEEEEKTGIINGTQFLAWGHLGFHWITIYHNIAGTLTESANAKLATPLFIHPSQLKGDRRGTLPEYEAQTNFPNPWEGGWWTLRDIVEQQKISAWATLDMAARNKDTLLRNAYHKATRQTERGACGSPLAYIVPKIQHDPLTASKLIEKLLVQGIKIHVTDNDFMADGVFYPAGSYVIQCEQPKSGLIKTLLGRTIYPENNWTIGRDGSPLRPQDTATDTMGEFMGVRVDPVDCCIGGNLTQISEASWPEGGINGEAMLYVLDCKMNESYKAVNRLLADDAKIYRTSSKIEVEGCVYPAGSFIVEGVAAKRLEVLGKELHLSFYAVDKVPETATEINKRRVGMYQRYWGGNMDEGWTRFILEQYEFPYKTIMDKEFKEGLKDLDVVILPDDPEVMITGIDIKKWWNEENMYRPFPNYPTEYISGIGEEGIKSLKSFVENGGTLVCFNNAGDLAINHFDLKVKNVVKDKPSKEFMCPGSTLHANFDTCHPAAFGMPSKGLIFFWNGPVYEISPSPDNDKYEIVVTYPDRDILQSGRLIGEENMKKKVAMIVAKIGKGKVVLCGFRPQHRAQTHGTYKLLFNYLIG